MSILAKIKQALCFHAMVYAQHCNLHSNGNYTYDCTGCGKTWTREEIEATHRKAKR